MEWFPFPLSAEGRARREAWSPKRNTYAFASHGTLGCLARSNEGAVDQLRQHAEHDGTSESGQ